jgi:hypothetical protein
MTRLIALLSALGCALLWLAVTLGRAGDWVGMIGDWVH